ncbi:ABC transporter ATP-binding protein [Tardiphaga robiniae]|uniref:ABC transporter ATP-binding protein n=1 Tax=Tardiphaga robiniae TaxID=943830 RepID=UPI0030846D54
MPGTRAIRRAIDEDVHNTAAGLDLTGLLQRRPAQLSGGQRQRTALARAMVRNPDVFLMDEPLSNLDAQLRADARGEITALHRRLGATIIYVTHDQTEAMTMADHVVVMRGGHILQAAAPQKIYDDPASLAVARFIGTVRLNEFQGELQRDGELHIGPLVVRVSAPNASNGPVLVGVRAEDMRIVPAKHGLPASVRRLERHGSDTMLHVDVEGQAVPSILRLAPQDADHYVPGAPLHIAPSPARLMLFNADGARIAAEIADIPAAPTLVRA